MAILTSMSHSEIMWSTFFLAIGLSVSTVILVYAIIDDNVGVGMKLTFRKVRDDFTIAFIIYFMLLSLSGILE